MARDAKPSPKTLAPAASVSSKTSKNAVEVNVLGQRMVVRCDGDSRHIERLVAYVNRKGDEVAAHGALSSTKLAALAALNIAEDYFRLLEDSREFRQAVAHKSRALLTELDAADKG